LYRRSEENLSFDRTNWTISKHMNSIKFDWSNYLQRIDFGYRFERADQASRFLCITKRDIERWNSSYFFDWVNRIELQQNGIEYEQGNCIELDSYLNWIKLELNSYRTWLYRDENQTDKRIECIKTKAIENRHWVNNINNLTAGTFDSLEMYRESNQIDQQ